MSNHERPFDKLRANRLSPLYHLIHRLADFQRSDISQAKYFTKILHRGKTAITIVVYDEYRLKSWTMSLAGGGPGQKLTTNLSKKIEKEEKQ